MKKIVMLMMVFAATALFAQSTLADDTHHHEKAAQAAYEQIAKPSEKMNEHESMMQESMQKMHNQMEAIKHAKEPNERLRLLQEHSESMHDSIKMMREMMSGMMMGGEMGSCHMMHGHSAGENALATPEQMAAPDKASGKPAKQTWVCPMHPEVAQDHPGACPVCGMDLVEMEQSGTSKSCHNHKVKGCMMGGGMKDGCMMGGAMKDGCMKGGMMEKHHMDMMLMLMEQMIEHNDAATAVQK